MMSGKYTIRVVNGQARYFDESGRDVGPAPTHGPNGEKVSNGAPITESVDLRVGTVLPPQDLKEAF